MSSVVRCRRGSDPVLCLWLKLVATAPIRPLGWEPPYDAGAAQGKNGKKTKKKKKNGVSFSPSPMELLFPCPTVFQCQLLQGLFLPMPGPQVWQLDMGLRTLTPVGESL